MVMTDYQDATAPPADRVPQHGSLHDEPFGDAESSTAKALKGVHEGMVLTEFEASERFDNALGPDTTRPDFLPEKFKDVEAFVESYKNLEREYHTTRAELKAQRETMEQFILEAQQEPYADDPVETMRWLTEQTQGVTDEAPYPDADLAVSAANASAYEAGEQVWAAALAERPEETAFAIGQQVQATMRTLPDWEEYRPLVNARILENDIQLPANPTGVVSVMAGVYADVKADVQARAEVQSRHATKMQAQTLTGPPGRPAATDADEDYWQSVKAVPSNRYGG
jgi:hypothetical protein